jgi:hypothetical protein
LLLRVSTNEVCASTSSRIATSPGAPICIVPIFGARLMIFAGVTVAAATACSSERPSGMNLLMTFGR